MPTLQILNKAPDFGEQLGQSLGSLLGGVAGGTLGNKLESHYKNKKIDTTSPGIAQLVSEMTGQEVSPESIGSFLKQGGDLQSLLKVSSTASALKQRQDAIKNEELEEQKSHALGQNVFNTSVNMLKKNVPGIGISPQTKIGFSRKGVQNRALFNGLRAKYESILLPMVNKGTLAKERFNYIMSNIPSADESQRSIAGKLYALGKELGFDTSELENIPWFKQTTEEFEEPSMKKTQGKEERKSLKEIFG